MGENKNPRLFTTDSNKIGDNSTSIENNAKQKETNISFKKVEQNIKRSEIVSKTRQFTNDTTIGKDVGGKGDVNTMGKLGRSKSAFHLDGKDDSNLSAR